MGLFDIFKKKEVVLTEKELKWNKMWELWVDGNIPSPYKELMTYQGEVLNGGHYQYFDNILNTLDLEKEILALEEILSCELRNNLKKAYNAYLVLEEKEDDDAEEIMEQCDFIFYENEDEINILLEEYADKIEL